MSKRLRYLLAEAKAYVDDAGLSEEYARGLSEDIERELAQPFVDPFKGYKGPMKSVRDGDFATLVKMLGDLEKAEASYAGARQAFGDEDTTSCRARVSLHLTANRARAVLAGLFRESAS